MAHLEFREARLISPVLVQVRRPKPRFGRLPYRGVQQYKVSIGSPDSCLGANGLYRVRVFSAPDDEDE